MACWRDADLARVKWRVASARGNGRLAAGLRAEATRGGGGGVRVRLPACQAPKSASRRVNRSRIRRCSRRINAIRAPRLVAWCAMRAGSEVAMSDLGRAGIASTSEI